MIKRDAGVCSSSPPDRWRPRGTYSGLSHHRPLVEQLHSEGHDVRALVRDASRAELLPDGIDIAVGNLDDAASVAEALRGVDSVFLLHTGPGTTQTEIMIDAARSAGVNRIVLLSSIGAHLRPLPTIGMTLAARAKTCSASQDSTSPTCGRTA